MRRIATAQLSGICSMVQGRTLRHPHWPVDAHGIGLRLARGANSTWKVRRGVRVNVSSLATNDSQQNHLDRRGPDDHLGDSAGAVGITSNSDTLSKLRLVRDLRVVSLTERRTGLDLADLTCALRATRWEDQPVRDSEVTATAAALVAEPPRRSAKPAARSDEPRRSRERSALATRTIPLTRKRRRELLTDRRERCGKMPSLVVFARPSRGRVRHQRQSPPLRCDTDDSARSRRGLHARSPILSPFSRESGQTGRGHGLHSRPSPW
jgi:hypothetical protein